LNTKPSYLRMHSKASTSICKVISERKIFSCLVACTSCLVLISYLPSAIAEDKAAEDKAAEKKAEKKARLLQPTSDFTKSEPFELYQGGSGTNLKQINRNAFSLPSAALSFEQQSDFSVGNGVFDRAWVMAPSSTGSSDGLGPLFNARSCQGCHIKDGRGHPPEPNDINMVSMLFSLSDSQGNSDENLGSQLQDQAIAGMQSEGQVQVVYEAVEFAYPNGKKVSLRRPSYSTTANLSEQVSLNPRIAPPMIGLGLIEAIAEQDILATADAADNNNDGISGRANFLPDGSLGRFGWKSTESSILDQVATAFLNDMGLSTKMHLGSHGDCTDTQVKCLKAIHGAPLNKPEVEDALLDFVVFYSANLAVPARRDLDDTSVLKGKQLFYEANCVACHTPKMATGADASKPQRNQLIWPYSDFLLHDMGPGLADTNPTKTIAGAEWRTQPLWGIGLTQTVNEHTFFLHDGRARNLEEAILWHGGEAEAARNAFVHYGEEERHLLLRFLESL